MIFFIVVGNRTVIFLKLWLFSMWMFWRPSSTTNHCQSVEKDIILPIVTQILLNKAISNFIICEQPSKLIVPGLVVQIIVDMAPIDLEEQKCVELYLKPKISHTKHENLLKRSLLKKGRCAENENRILNWKRSSFRI